MRNYKVLENLFSIIIQHAPYIEKAENTSTSTTSTSTTSTSPDIIIQDKQGRNIWNPKHQSFKQGETK